MASAVAASKKRKFESLEAIKAKLIELGREVSGKKPVLTALLRHTERIKSLESDTPIDHHWNSDDMREFQMFLPLDDYDHWDPAEVKLVHSMFYTRYCSPEVMAVSANVEWHTKFQRTADRLFNVAPKYKTETIIADDLDLLTKRLFKKKVNKWGDAEGDLLLAYLGNVARVDARRSTQAAIDRYFQLCDMLGTFYVRRPDIKAKVDPDFVIFDLSSANAIVYQAQLALYVPPVHVGAVPHPTNPGVVPTIFPMLSIPAANHLIGWMTGTVANLRATLLYGVNNPPLIY